MAGHEVNRLQAYATAVAGSILCFLTLGSAVAFFDVATVSYLHLPTWMLAATLAATVGPVGWFALQLFGKACRIELAGGPISPLEQTKADPPFEELA